MVEQWLFVGEQAVLRPGDVLALEPTEYRFGRGPLTLRVTDVCGIEWFGSPSPYQTAAPWVTVFGHVLLGRLEPRLACHVLIAAKPEALRRAQEQEQGPSPLPRGRGPVAGPGPELHDTYPAASEMAGAASVRSRIGRAV